MVIGQELLIRDHPVAEEEEQARGEVELVEDALRETMVVHRWKSVGVEEHGSLAEVKHSEGEGCDREQDGHSEAVHEGDVDDVLD